MILDPFLTLVAQCFLALLLLSTGLHKSTNPERVRAALSAYRVVPASCVRAVAYLVVGIELTVGAALMVPPLCKSASLAAAGAFAVYFGVMGLAIVRGYRNLDCGCSFHGRAAPLSGAHLVRNAVLVSFAVVASMPDSRRALGWLDRVQITAAVWCLALIYLSADSLLASKADVTGTEG
jgi:hypothetical protein